VLGAQIARILQKGGDVDSIRRHPGEDRAVGVHQLQPPSICPQQTLGPSKEVLGDHLEVGSAG